MSRVFACVMWCWAAGAWADPVPADLQAELTSKVMKYDRNFAVRAGDHTVVLIAFKQGVGESERVAQQMKSAFASQPTLGGAKHTEELFAYTTPAELVATARAKRAALVVLAPGVNSDGQAIAKAFEGYDGLTASTSGEGVEKGIVLGFELVSGKPKMLVHLEQAKKQKTDFRAEVLKLMKVFP
jgi:hypothetical protein